MKWNYIKTHKSIRNGSSPWTVDCRREEEQVLLKYFCGRSDKLKGQGKFQHADSSIVLIVSRLSLFFRESSRADCTQFDRVCDPKGLTTTSRTGQRDICWCVGMPFTFVRGRSETNNNQSQLRFPDYLQAVSNELSFLKVCHELRFFFIIISTSLHTER